VLIDSITLGSGETSIFDADGSAIVIHARLTTISPILWVILESGRLRANLKATEARYRQTVAVSGNYLRLAQAQYKFGLVDYLISSTPSGCSSPTNCR